MANSLTGLLPVMYNAMDVVSREMVGFIPAVSRDATAEMAAVDQTVRSPVVPTMTAKTITPKNIADSGDDQTIGSVDIVINNQRFVDFNLTGEQERGLGQANNAAIAEARFAQSFRTLVNEIETDIAELYVAASRAHGTAGTTPFGTADDLTQLSGVLQILDENGAPTSDRHIVLGSSGIANLIGKQPSMFKANEAGSNRPRVEGNVGQMFGATLHQSGQVQAHTKGAGVGYDINNGSGEAVGQTTLTLDGGTVNTTGITAGDVVTFAGDINNKYVVTTGSTATGGDIVIGEPGLRVAAADAIEMTIGDSYAANMAFSRDAIHLAARLPAVPTGGDQADDRTTITDPISGLTFEVAVYRQMRQITYFIGICWGVKVTKPAHLALLLG